MDAALPLHVAARSLLRGLSDNGRALLASRARLRETARARRPRALRLEPHNLLRPRAHTLGAPRPIPTRPRNRAGGRAPALLAQTSDGDARSEERRVGKECRSRWS